MASFKPEWVCREKELVLWAKYDVERAIPSLVDGLKPGQRKAGFVPC